VPGETSTVDNSAEGGIVTLAFPGDINADGKVDMRDIGTCCNAFGTIPGAARWNPNADINNDLSVNMRDIGLTCAYFGQE
jgi:hypothetical protein